MDAKTETKDMQMTDEAVADTELYVDPVQEKKLLRKLDLWLSPVMTLIFLCAYLDRSNIGNAASAGMTKDLGMTSNDLGSMHRVLFVPVFVLLFSFPSSHANNLVDAVTLFYVLYVSFEVPCSLLMKRLRPSRMIPILILAWSVVVIGTGFVRTTGQLYALRILLGLFESGMFPCLALYISIFYKAEEQALRVSYMFVSSALSGAFGGLFAYALLHMDGVQGMAGWRWLFIVEGCVSVAVALLVYLFLPDSFETARFLTDDDRQLMRTRALLNQRYNGRPDFDWGEVRKAVTDPKLWVSCWNQFCGDICSFGLSSFMPLIIKSFGFSTVATQLLTMPVYFWASAGYTFVSWLSDRCKTRYFFMVPAVLVTAVGYAVNLGVGAGQRGALYFSLFLIAPGIYIIVGINATWLLNSHAGYHKRATAIGMNQTLGNCAGFVVCTLFINFILRV